MPGTRFCQRAISRNFALITFTSVDEKLLGRNGVGEHHLFPFRPFRIRNLNHDWSASCQPVADSPKNSHVIGFKLLTRTTSGAQTTSSKGIANSLGGQFNPGRHALKSCDQRRTV